MRSILAFTIHCSGTNYTNNPRSAYLAQYSAELLSHDGNRLWGNTEPLLKDGKSVMVMGESPEIASLFD